MDPPVPDVVARYFEADARRDIDAVVAPFTDEAVVVDEDRTWQGTTRIREWREGPAAKYRYTTELTGIRATGTDRFLVTGRLEGTFPAAQPT